MAYATLEQNLKSFTHCGEAFLFPVGAAEEAYLLAEYLKQTPPVAEGTSLLLPISQSTLYALAVVDCGKRVDLVDYPCDGHVAHRLFCTAAFFVY